MTTSFDHFCVRRASEDEQGTVPPLLIGQFDVQSYRRRSREEIRGFRMSEKGLYHPSVFFRAHINGSRVASFGGHSKTVSGKCWPLPASRRRSAILGHKQPVSSLSLEWLVPAKSSRSPVAL